MRSFFKQYKALAFDLYLIYQRSSNILEVKPKAVCGDQVMANGVTQDGGNTKLAEGPMDKVTTMLPTVWFGAQSGM